MQLVKEDIRFERNPSPRNIKNKLFGFRKGDLITPDDEKSGPYNQIYLIIEKGSEKFNCFFIGTIHRNAKRFAFKSDNHPGNLDLWADGKRVINDEEASIIKKDIKPFQLDQIKKETGIFPII